MNMMRPGEGDDILQEEAPEVRLYFFRHDEKSANPEGTDASDYDVRLTEAGRKQAAERSPFWERWHDRAGTTFIFGSPRKRSLETALLKAYPEAAIHSTMEETQDKLRETLGTHIRLESPSLPHGSGKVKNWAQTENLNFAFGSGAMRPLYDQHYLQDKDLLHYVYTHSDEDLLATGDVSAKSYSLYAADTAKEVLRASKVLGNMVRHDTSRSGLLQNRFYGSHQSVTECFVLKVLEKTGGEAAAKHFLSQLAGKQGFDFSEGFDVRVVKSGKNPSFELHFRGDRISFSLEILEEIIADGAALENKLFQSR